MPKGVQPGIPREPCLLKFPTNQPPQPQPQQPHHTKPNQTKPLRLERKEQPQLPANTTLVGGTPIPQQDGVRVTSFNQRPVLNGHQGF